MKLDTLFSPMKIGSCEIPNRLVVPAMVTNYCNLEGTITPRYLRYMEEKAKGGWGLLITEDYCVQENRKATPASRDSGMTGRSPAMSSSRMRSTLTAPKSSARCTTPVAR